MRSTISAHLRSNIVGYVALFLVLTGGTAYALDGTNTVFSDDIVNGQVKTNDLGGGAVTSGKTEDGSLTGTDLADRTIGGQKVGTETLTGANVNDGSLFGADIANDSLTSSDIGTHAIGSSELDPTAFEPTDIAQKSVGDPRYGIAPNAVQGDEVSDNTLTGADINESTLDTPAVPFAKTDGSFTLPSDGTERTIVSRRVAPGDYVVFAKASLTTNDGQFATCRINAIRSGASTDLDSAQVPTVKKSFGPPGAWGEMSLMGLVGFGGDIDLSLVCRGDGVTTSNTRLVAVKVNRLIGTDAP
jgi:hypothetical protein